MVEHHTAGLGNSIIDVHALLVLACSFLSCHPLLPSVFGLEMRSSWLLLGLGVVIGITPLTSAKTNHVKRAPAQVFRRCTVPNTVALTFVSAHLGLM